jgi:hypothetical protein
MVLISVCDTVLILPYGGAFFITPTPACSTLPSIAGGLSFQLEVENFSGRTVDAIKQDFFATIYMANVAAVACWDAQKDVNEKRELKNNKYSYHVNVNHAIGTLKDRFIMMLLEPSPRIRRKMLKQILFLLKESVVPTRPGRSIPRNPSPRKSRFRFNRKSNC